MTIKACLASFFLLLPVWAHMYLWYLPFSDTMDGKTKRHMYMGFAAISVLAFISIIGIYALGYGAWFTHFGKLYYTVIWVPGLLLFNFLLPGMFPRHIFVFSMVGLHAFFCHTLATNLELLIVSEEVFRQHLPEYLILLFLFMVAFTPFVRPIFKNFFRLHLEGVQSFAWHYTCLIPLCAYLNEFFYMNWFPDQVVGVMFFFPRMMDSILALAVGLSVYEGTKVAEQYILAKEKEHREEKQLTYLSTYAGSLEASQRYMKIIRHDKRHFLRSLSACLESGNIKDARALIAHAEGDLSRTKIRKICENTVINAALSHFVAEAKEKKIPFVTKVLIPGGLKEEIGLSMVLANLVENAFHASEKEKPENRQITLIARVENGNLTALVRNYYSGKVILAKDGLPMTLEENHGIGMESLRRFCKENGASALWKQENGWVSAYLQCPVNEKEAASTSN